MHELISDLTLVWTPWGIFWAIISGLIIGIGLSWPISNPLWSAKVATRQQVSLFVAVMTSWIVTVLYVATIIAAVMSGDVGLMRAVSRYTLFLFAGMMSGVGCWIALRIRGTW